LIKFISFNISHTKIKIYSKIDKFILKELKKKKCPKKNQITENATLTEKLILIFYFFKTMIILINNDDKNSNNSINNNINKIHRPYVFKWD